MSKKSSKTKEERLRLRTMRRPEVWLRHHVQGVTEPLQRILKRHDIASAVRPHSNIKQILVDKRKTNERQVVCTNMCYISETGRTFDTRPRTQKRS